MIDYTNIQLNPVPNKLISFQKVNAGLKPENNVLMDALIVVVLGSIFIIGYNIYKDIQENEDMDIKKWKG